MHHALKCAPEYFDAVADGSKPFEVRINDRGFKVGHHLVIRELNAAGEKTGRSIIKEVTYVLTDAFPGIAKGYVCMGLTQASGEGRQ